jgi:CBS domain-containing protein
MLAAAGGAPMLTVRDLMTRDVVTVGLATPLKEVARLLVEHAVSGLPVIDGERVVGVVSEGDLLAKEQAPGEVDRRPFGRILGESRATREQLAKMEATTAGEAMSAPAVTIAPERPIVEAATAMARSGVNRLPVVDGDRLVGIISRADVMRALTRSDEELAEEIRTAVLYQTLWLDPAVFEVAVTNGVARIRGRVARRSTAELIERIPALIPGVIGVDADVSWDIDDQPYPGA